MPNWCDSTTTITATSKEMFDAIVAAAEADQLLNYLVPLPGEWDYSECVDKWGTKWDVAGVEVDADETDLTITLNFQSAWAPPTQAYLTFQERNEGVEITSDYYEPGCDFVGQYVNGIETDFTVTEMLDQDESEWPDDFAEMADIWGLEKWEDDEEFYEGDDDNATDFDFE